MSLDCIFCHLDRSVLVESELSLAFYDGFPVSKGHTLIVPRRHAMSIWELTAAEYADAFNLVRQAKVFLQEEFQPQGFNVGVNCGEVAGQSVWHAHIHLIPRYSGDVSSPRGGVRNIIPGRGRY